MELRSKNPCLLSVAVEVDLLFFTKSFQSILMLHGYLEFVRGILISRQEVDNYGPIVPQCHKLNDMVYSSYRMPECASYDCA